MQFTGRLSNLYILGNKLSAANRYVYPFKFDYNGINAYVIYHRLEKPYKKYWTIRLTFYNFSDNSNDFECYANKNSTNMTYTQLKRFFHLKSSGDSEIGEIFNGFYKKFNSHIPSVISDIADNHLKESALSYIGKHDRESEKIYLFDVRHTSGHRTNFNNDKAALRYPDIYRAFKYDYHLSFFFTTDASKETTLEELLKRGIKKGFK